MNTENRSGLAQALATLRSEELRSVYQHHSKRLESLFAGHRVDTPLALSGITVTITDPEIDPGEWFALALSELAHRVPRASDYLVFRPMSICYNPRSIHFVDSLFGADIFRHEFSDQWQVHLLTTPVGTLEFPDLANHPAWRKVQEVARLFCYHDPQNVKLELPTLSSALNIAVNLYGGEILVAMLTNPEAARHDLRIINDVIVSLHTWFIENVPSDRSQPIAMAGRYQPTGHGQICGCTTQLPSNELYEEFIAPLDAEVLSLYDHGGLIHLCGAHTQHIPTWRKMKELKAVQMNDRAALDLPAYFESLRDDQILYVNVFEDMSPAAALEITGGERTVLAGDFDDAARRVLETW